MKVTYLFDRFLYFPIFKAGLHVGTLLTRLGWDSLTKKFMRMNAKLVLFIRQGRYQQNILDAGQEWKRMFPDLGMQKITSSDDHTVYAETHAWCPLRGTGDVRSCYKLMEFDRCLLETIGGQFIVLQSQAEPEIEICRIAIRSPDRPVDDLVPAYQNASS